MKCDDAPNMHGRGRNRNFGREHKKENIYLDDMYADRRTQTKYTVEKWS